MEHIVIIGGGISGLSAAYFLSRQNLQCTLIETQPRLGGLIKTTDVDGCRTELGPDSFLAKKTSALELIREIGLEDQVIGSPSRLRRTYVLKRGRLTPLPDGLQLVVPTKLRALAATRLIGFGAKLRAAAEYFRRPQQRRKDCSAAEFILDHFGPEVVEYIAQPMLRGVYGGSPEHLSAECVLGRFWRLERTHGSLIRGLLMENQENGSDRAGSKPLFQSLRGGLQLVTDRLAERLQPQVTVLTATANGLAARGAKTEVATSRGTIECDRVILATPAAAAAELLRGMEPDLAGRIAAIPYSSAITVALVYRQETLTRPLDAFGFLVPRAEDRPLAACTWVNTKWAGRAAEGRVLMRAFLTAEEADERMSLADKELTAVAHQQLTEIMGVRQNPVASLVSRWPHSMPQYEVGHAARLREIEARTSSLQGVHLLGNYFDGVGIPDCIRRSRRLVAQITEGQGRNMAK